MIFEIDLEGEDILKKTPDEQEAPDSVIFNVRLTDPSPAGVHISKRSTCQIEIVAEDVDIEEDKIEKEKMIEFFVEQNDDTWAYQFKKAIILQPTINENDEIDMITGSEAFFHLAAIGW